MKRIFLLTLAPLAYAQMPTQADLEATLAKWNDFVKPGKVMVTKSSASVFLLSDDLFSSVEKAYAIGDREIVIGLAKQGKAIIETRRVRVRIIDSENALCPSFKALGMRCRPTAEMMQNVFDNQKRPGGTEARQQSLLEKRTAFLQHDIGSFVQDEYAKVRILDGGHLGETGLIKLSQLESTNAMK